MTGRNYNSHSISALCIVVFLAVFATFPICSLIGKSGESGPVSSLCEKILENDMICNFFGIERTETPETETQLK